MINEPSGSGIANGRESFGVSLCNVKIVNAFYWIYDGMKGNQVRGVVNFLQSIGRSIICPSFTYNFLNENGRVPYHHF